MKKNNTFLMLSYLMVNSLFSQQTTINQSNKSEREIASLHKALIIPFEPKLYYGEIDYNINALTKLSAKEIKNKFRNGLNEQLYEAFKNANFNALDLMDDTSNYKTDIETIYQNLSYVYLKAPNQTKYKSPKNEKKVKVIQKGQLNAETSNELRFMNAKINSPTLFTNLHKKFKTDIFIFINQLDIKASGSKIPGELGNGNLNRRISVHYTVYNLDLVEINSGLAEEDFDPSLNNPKKIIDSHFNNIAKLIVQRVNLFLNPVSK